MLLRCAISPMMKASFSLEFLFGAVNNSIHFDRVAQVPWEQRRYAADQEESTEDVCNQLGSEK